MKKGSILIILLFQCVNIFAQEEVVVFNFTHTIREATGDLNNDGLIDQAIISMDVEHTTRPLRLQVLFSKPNGSLEVVFSSTNVIEAMYPTRLHGVYNDNQIPRVYIEDEKLQLEYYIEGIGLYEFRYTNNNFELIQFTSADYDGENMIEIDFNLLTGSYFKQTEILYTEEITETINKEVLIKPLPQLKNFSPLKNEYY